MKLQSHQYLMRRLGGWLATMLITATACASPVALQQPTNTPVPVVVVPATDAPPADTEGSPSGELIPIRLQLQWVAQSQFAGYYAAVDQGFYEDEGLDVTILEGAVDIVPQQVLA